MSDEKELIRHALASKSCLRIAKSLIDRAKHHEKEKLRILKRIRENKKPELKLVKDDE